MSFRINHGYIQPLQETGQLKKDNSKIEKSDSSFKNILDQQISKSRNEIKISNHANRRLAERNITLTDFDLQALSDAMDKADKKGARESLMLYKNIAFIASIGNRTLITAMDPRSNKENVFTNIDSAVIVE